MVNTKENAVMVSRSLRLRPDTLKVLEKEAVQMGKGITVHIRDILEAHVSTKELLETLITLSQEEEVSNGFELRASLA